MRAQVCLLILLAAVAAVPAAAEEISRDFHRTFEVSEGARLVLEQEDGDVTITPWERDQIDVKVRYRAEHSGVGVGGPRDLEVDFSQEGDLVRVVGRETGGNRVGFFVSRVYEYTYTVKAPPYVALALRTEDGNVGISGWRGDIEGRLEDGDVELADIEAARTLLVLEDGDVTIAGIRGELSLEVEDGDVAIDDCEFTASRFRLEDGELTLSRCGGSMEIQVEDGDVTLQKTRAASLAIRTQDGSVAVDLLAAAAAPTVEIHSADGDVELDLAPEISAAFSIGTHDGWIDLDLPSATEVDEGRNHASGRLGTGAGSIRISTQDGSVSLRQR